MNDQIRRAITSTKSAYRAGYVAPYLRQAKEVAWEYLKRYSRPVLGRPPHESELWVELVNGARLRIYGADNPDGLRGSYFDDVVLDEYADMSPSVWGSVIRPMLADRQGSATFIGTPKGRNNFFEMFDRAKDDPDWFRFFLPASATGILSEAELASARRDMTPEQYAQEFECDWSAAIVGAYYGKELADAERDGRIRSVVRDPSLPVHTAWDLGIGDSTAIWVWQVAGGEIRVLDYIEDCGKALPFYVAELNARGWSGGVDWVPHDARVRELQTGRTRVETLVSLGRNPKLVPDHKVMDGINALRLSLPRMWFDADKCRDGLECLRQYRADYDEKGRTFRDEPKHDWTSHGCLIAGTIVKTARGDVPIEDVVVGDMVWTPGGFARVSWSGPTRFADELFEITVGDRSIVCTGNHPIFTTGGLIRADEIRYGNVVIAEDSDEWTVRRATGSRTGFRDAFIEFTKAKNTGCGRRVAICGSAAKRIGSSSKRAVTWPRNGIGAKLVGNGIRAMRSMFLGNESGLPSGVKSAVENTEHLCRGRRNSVTRIVKHKLCDGGEGKTLVFDLTVEKHHCFLANGILVSNSDAARYLAMAWREITPRRPDRVRDFIPTQELTMDDWVRYSGGGARRDRV